MSIIECGPVENLVVCRVEKGKRASCRNHFQRCLRGCCRVCVCVYVVCTIFFGNRELKKKRKRGNM